MCPALGQLSPPAHCCNHEGIVEIGDDPRHPTVKLFIHSHPRTLPSPIFTILVFSNCDFNYTFTMDIQKRHLSALSPCLRLPTPNEGFANKWPASQWQHSESKHWFRFWHKVRISKSVIFGSNHKRFYRRKLFKSQSRWNLIAQYHLEYLWWRDIC